MSIFLVRHAKAGSRHDWKGPDDERPLSKRGRRQAGGLVDLLADRGIASVVSSPSVRCVQTVEPLAHALGVGVQARAQLCEGTGRAEVAELVADVLPTLAVVCTHGDVIPVILEVLADDHGLDLPDDYPCAKGSIWELADDGTGRLRARYLPPPG